MSIVDEAYDILTAHNYGPGYTDESKEASEGLITSLGGIPDEEEF